MMSGESSPGLQPSISSSNFGLADNNDSLDKIATVISTRPLPESDTEVIEEAIVHKTLPMPEPQPKIERNGLDKDVADGKPPQTRNDDDSCVKCVYYTQQCCECTIL